MGLIVFIEVADLECPEVLTHSERHAFLSGIFIGATLLRDLVHNMSLYLILVIPI